MISRSAAGGEGGSDSLMFLPPSPYRLQNPHKGCKNVLSCGYVLSHCGSRDADVESPRQEPECQASLWEGDKRVDAKEISKPCSFPSSALHLLLVTCIHDNASAEEKSSINYMGDAFYNKKMQFSCVWYELDRESRAEPSTLCMDHL